MKICDSCMLFAMKTFFFLTRKIHHAWGTLISGTDIVLEGSACVRKMLTFSTERKSRK